MLVLTLISALLTLPFNAFGAGADTVRVYSSSDGIQVYAVSASMLRTTVADTTQTPSPKMSDAGKNYPKARCVRDL